MRRTVEILMRLLLLLLVPVYVLNGFSFFLNGNGFDFYFLENIVGGGAAIWLILISVAGTAVFLRWSSKPLRNITAGLLAGFYIATPLPHRNKQAIYHYIRVYVLPHSTPKSEPPPSIPFRCEKDQLIAHAGGQIGPYTYTDSLEALDNAYRNGIRLFELDLRRTRDGKIVAVHDWKEWKRLTAYPHRELPTLKQFMSYRLYGRFTPLDLSAINRWFSRHTDAVLVTDKLNDPALMARQFIDPRRLRMELFDLDALFRAEKFGIVGMPSWNTTLAKLRDPSAFVARMGIRYIVVPYSVYRKAPERFRRLSHRVPIYLFGHYRRPILPRYYYGRYIDETRLPRPVCRGYDAVSDYDLSIRSTKRPNRSE